MSDQEDEQRDNQAGEGLEEQDGAVLPFDDGSVGRIIRRQWHEGRWFFSIVDVIAVLTDNDIPRRYWSDLKRKLRDEGFELYEKIVQLKMRSPLDGKKYATDAADKETMLRIIQSVPSPKAEPVKQWLAKVGAQKLDEAAAELDEDQKRLLLRGEVANTNKSLAQIVSERGVVTRRDYAIFHDFGYRGYYHETARQIAARMGVPEGQILEYMVSDSLAGNLFRLSLTDLRLRNNADITGKDAVNKAIYDVSAAVRQVTIEQAGIPPEQFPRAEKSIQELEREEQERARRRLQPPLFPDAETED